MHINKLFPQFEITSVTNVVDRPDTLVQTGDNVDDIEAASAVPESGGRTRYLQGDKAKEPDS